MKIIVFFVHRIAAVTWIIGGIYHRPYRNFMNYTDHEKHIVYEIKELSKVKWFRTHKGSFGKLYRVPFAEMLTKRGMAFAFNILDFDVLLNSET